jgi:hypothetical protein
LLFWRELAWKLIRGEKTKREKKNRNKEWIIKTTPKLIHQPALPFMKALAKTIKLVSKKITFCSWRKPHASP